MVLRGKYAKRWALRQLPPQRGEAKKMRTDLRRLVLGLALPIALILTTAIPSRAADDARDLVKRALEALPHAPFVAKMKLTTNNDKERMLRLSHKLVNGSRASYLEVTAPEDLQGVRFLFLEHPDKSPEQYMKVAASRTTVRVANEVRKQPFLGSIFYVADLVEPAIDDFNYTLVGEEDVAGRRTKLIEVTPKDPTKEVYGKVIVAIDPNDLLILRRQLFDHQGKLQKVWSVDRVEKIDGFWTMMDQTMQDVQDKTQSKLQILDIKYNADLKDEMFTPKFLLRESKS